MARVFVEENSLQDIANAIREKNGSADTYKPSQMGDAVRGIQSGGEDFLRYATRVYFGKNNLPPITVLNLDNVSNFDTLISASTELEELTINCTNQVTTMHRAIYNPSSFYKLRKIIFNVDTSKCTNFTNAFSYLKCTDENGVGNVEIIGELDFSSSTNHDYPFSGSNGLKEVRFVSGSIHKSILITLCPHLSDASIQSIIDGLATVTTAQTLTLHADVKAKLTETQISQITSKNWTLA